MEPERRKDSDSRDRIGEIEKNVKEGLEKLERGRLANRAAIKWLTGGFVILAIGVTAALALYGLLNGETNDLANDNADLIESVQTSREDATRTNCQQVNTRHDTTIKTLDQALAGQPAELAGPTKALASLLVDAIVPVQDCEARVRELTDLDNEAVKKLKPRNDTKDDPVRQKRGDGK